MRNFNEEIKDIEERNYAYNFDLDIMHAYYMKSMLPFFKKDDVLELGSYKGFFTKRLEPIFKNITCIEASNIAIAEAKKILRDDIKIIHSSFEDATLNSKFNNIIMTHVLEHVKNPVNVLKKINNEWLADDGLFFIICPNANAPSRQIAVNMGIISHNSAVTEGEKKHGHQITYAFDTLERDVKQAGLNVIYKSGIFFKALANYQWDKLLKTDIISKEYLDGCYSLGLKYPDLCSSIFLVCKKDF